ncbi:MAG: hypothetical protein NPIRA06_29480 [Nitrospirales bacterium]|nr:MAG: hypothetical protein NPIRA06_29480 [Nitrospirales bacterium]
MSGGLPMPAYGCNSLLKYLEDRMTHEITRIQIPLDPDPGSRGEFRTSNKIIPIWVRRSAKPIRKASKHT